jgi:glutamine transport system ATP-binding protein
MSPIIQVRNLKKSFGPNEVLKGISVDIATREVVVVIGPSGSGKSTFSRCLNLLEEAQAGDIHIEGVSLMGPRTDISEVRAEVGMVFQQFNLFPHMKVIDNITIAPVRVRKSPIEKARVKAMELLQGRLGGKGECLSCFLSGGQAQRVADRQGAGHGTQDHAVRRAYLCTRSRDGRRSSGCYEGSG